MAVKRTTQNPPSMEDALESQIGNIGAPEEAYENEANFDNLPTEEESRKILEQKRREAVTEDQGIEKPKKDLGKLQYFGNTGHMTNDELAEFAKEHKTTRVGQNIGQNVELREGWLTVDRELLGDRNVFYPTDWEFRIKPATVEAIRNWSTLDEENVNSVDVVFDEILKSCLAIRTPNGPMPWNQINAWDRLFFVLLVREYTFINGEVKKQFTYDCPNCESEVTFELHSSALMFDVPDEEVMDAYDQERRVWTIIPSEYDVEYTEPEILLYNPTREKDSAIKAYLYDKLQKDRNAKIDRVFYKFLPWLLPKISKDTNIAKTQIKKAENEYKSWDVEMFEFMDNVINNITVTPGMNLLSVCPACGEEVTAPIQFPDGISSLFRHDHRFKKFGKK